MPDMSRTIKVIDGDLSEVRDEALEVALAQQGEFDFGAPLATLPPHPTPKRYFTQDEKIRLFTELRARQQGEGYADTWLRIAFNATVGHFPPAEWMRGATGRAPTPRQMKEILNQMDRGEF
jgi:hypothetical protein